MFVLWLTMHSFGRPKPRTNGVSAGIYTDFAKSTRRKKLRQKRRSINSRPKGEDWLRLVPVNVSEYDEQDIPKSVIMKVFKERIVI